jgi:hypothetical protein
MWIDAITPGTPRFESTEQVLAGLRAAAREHADLARYEEIGRSEEGREIGAIVLGRGARRISLLAGSHADEPVGQVTLARFVRAALEERGRLEELLDRFTFHVIPHVNPDGAARNAPWIERWPDAPSYIEKAVREAPGRDVEFGYPAMRRENSAVAGFLSRHAPFHLHMSLHGMAVSEGGLLLVERHWIERTAALRERFAAALQAAGLRLFDHDRGGEKGFLYIGPGFTTTPEAAAMRAHFEALDQPQTAALFHATSMEYVRSLGGDPLCLVTELPLFVLTRLVEAPQPGRPTTYLRFKQLLPELAQRIASGESIDAELERFGLQPLELARAVQLQLEAIDCGMEAIG